MDSDGIDMVMDYVHEVTGIALVNGRAAVFKKKVVERQNELGIDNPFSYFLFVKHRAPDTEVIELLDRLAVSETYFYREEGQFTAFREEVLGQVFDSGLRVTGESPSFAPGVPRAKSPTPWGCSFWNDLVISWRPAT